MKSQKPFRPMNTIIKNVKIGNPHISIFYGLIDAGKIKIPTPNKRIDTEIIFDCKRASN
jgi:hypothetical protein